MSLHLQKALTPDEQRRLEQGIADLEASGLVNEQKAWIRHLLESAVKISVPQVLSVWKIAEERMQYISGLQSKIIWIEEGNPSSARPSGYQHVLEHEPEFAQDKIKGVELIELIEAATKFGTYVGDQTSIARKKAAIVNGRPIFLIIYKGIPLAVAISIGNNGFVVGMNRQSWEKNLGNLSESGIGLWPPIPNIATDPYWRKDGVMFALARDGVTVQLQGDVPDDSWVYNQSGWADFGDGVEHKWRWHGAFANYIP